MDKIITCNSLFSKCYRLRLIHNHLMTHSTPLSVLAARFSHSYRNRYNHYESGYPRFTVGFGYISLSFATIGGFIFFMFGGGHLLEDNIEQYFENKKKVSKIKSVKCESSTHIEENETVINEDLKIPKEKNSFRTRKFIAYEDRIRAYSTPDKIFRYFATLKCSDEEGNIEIFMTPNDFLCAITPGIKQPDGLALDSFKRFDPKRDHLDMCISKDSVFYCLGEQALISFSDFIFLLTVISTPQRQFEIAFRMFDINGDGELDSSEFDVVRSVILDTTAMGQRHRDHSTTGNTIKSVSHSALHNYFFGKDGNEKLTIAKFLDFQALLQEEICMLEFERLNQEDGLISEEAFAKSLLTYAGFSENKRRLMLRRVKSRYPKEESVGINFAQFLAFSRLLRSITELDTALTFHTLAGAAIDTATFLHMAKVVANVELTPHVVEVVFTLFDDNDDGQLSYKEFVQVMKNRLLRGLDKPMDTGFIRFVNAVMFCVRHEIKRHLE